ncbi:MAG: zinc-binding dehydrogenase [Caldilineaceae bacterium]|nr:zinc-binding dehydrogenase [Caldilineaceae bacterium]
MPKRLAIVAPYQVKILEYEQAAPGPHDVLVQTEIASGKHGTTTGMFDGGIWHGHTFSPDIGYFQQTAAPEENSKPIDEAHPMNAGTSGVGVVTAVGSSVTRWQIGDRVFGPMDIREINTCHEDRLHALDDIRPETALCIEPAYVAFHCIRESAVRYGDTVAVVGLGAIGLLTVEMARAAGAAKIFAIDPLPNRRAWAAENGADEVYDPTAGDVAQQLRAANGGNGVDIAIEISGSYRALDTALKVVRMCGTVCSAGFYKGDAQGLFLGRDWHHKRLNLIVPHGCGWGHQPREYPNWTTERANQTLVAMMHKGLLRAPGLINPIVPITAVQPIFDKMKSDPNQLLKYAVTL